MILKLIHRLLERRHYWRYIGFSELAQLYAAELIRSLGLGLVSVLVVIFMYQNGYGLLFIALFYAAYSGFRALLTIPLAYLVARIGPKHGNLLSNLLLIPMMLSLPLLPEHGWPVLIFFGTMQAVATTLYFISYYVNFSKIKHADHAGKEIGYVFILRRVATSLSPLVGGVIAFMFGPEATMYVAAVLLSVAAVPLMRTGEPTRTRQKVTIRSLNWGLIRKNLRGMVMMGMDSAASVNMWPLFVAIAVFGVSGNSIYAEIGAITSVAIFAALFVTHVFGKVIDRRQGGTLLRYSAIGNAALHAMRPFVQTPYGVVMTNITNETVTTGIQMPFIKAMFDVADGLPGYRIAYLAMMEMSASIGATLFYLLVGVCVYNLGEIEGMKASYFILAPVFLLLLDHGFKLLRVSEGGVTGVKAGFQAILSHK